MNPIKIDEHFHNTKFEKKFNDLDFVNPYQGGSVEFSGNEKDPRIITIGFVPAENPRMIIGKFEIRSDLISFKVICKEYEN